MRVLVLCLDAVAILTFIGGVIGYLYYSLGLQRYRKALKSVVEAKGTVVNVFKDKDDTGFVHYAISSEEVLDGQVFETSLYPNILGNCIKVGDVVSVKFFGDKDTGAFLISENPFSRVELLEGLLCVGSVRCRRVMVWALAFAFVAVVLSLLV